MITSLSAAPTLAPEDILVVGCLRNEMLRLPEFLSHHRQLGVTQFLLIDNASDDGTTDFLLAEGDVCVFHTAEPYSASNCGVDWINEVLHRHGTGHWVLLLDADELFVFPGYETTGLNTLLTWLDTCQAEAMIAPMLDMYSHAPLARTNYVRGTSLIEACPYFDGTGYTFRQTETGLRTLHRGGPRQRLFWDGHGRDYPAPVLDKIPLVKWRDDLRLTASTHVLKGVAAAPVTGALLHFKFLQDFAASAAAEAARQEHFMAARQYTAYSDVLSAAPDFCAFGEVSVKYRGSRQLVELGLMQVPPGYPF